MIKYIKHINCSRNIHQSNCQPLTTSDNNFLPPSELSTSVQARRFATYGFVHANDLIYNTLSLFTKLRSL
ncbi:hypothetical protein T4C_853 [Trichinella pseudospiralis]|uniref:Uncharacterized protein n=1 Tax=Trichinella pseudospiralis TaxID=6337 RepID=A0A0V1HWQ2_TRIPS|nr:hypothetical protein T4C_853 [Trichinella pseudospiralis]